jgi:hypothetical protein
MPNQAPQQGYPQQHPQQPYPQQYPQQMPQQPYPPQYPQQYPPQYPQQMPQQQYPQQYPPQYPPQMPQQPYPPQYPPQMPGFNPNQPQAGFNQPQQGFGVPQLNNSSRFGGTPPAPQPQPVQPMPTPVQAPAPTITLSQQLTKLSKVKMVSTSYVVGTYLTPFTPDDILFNDDSVAVVDCVEEAVEQIADLFNSDPSTKVVKKDYVILNKVFGLKNTLVEDNLASNPKDLSKVLKEFHASVNNKSMLVYALSLNELFTSYINDILYINTDGNINIDSFMDDYNDLCKALTGPNLHIGKELNDKLDLYLVDIKTSYSSFHFKESVDAEDGTQGESSANYTPLLDRVSLFYVDLLNMELNLNILPKGVMTPVINTENSRFSTNSLYTLVDSIYSTPVHLSSVRNFLVTFDKSMYEIFTNNTGKYFIKAW